MGKAPGAIVLGVVPLVIGWAIPSLVEDAVGTALGHALGHELVRRRSWREWEANGGWLHRRSSWARCSSRAGVWLFAFAVAAIGELVAKPAGAAGVALVPAHRDLVRGTPARVVVVPEGEALGFRRLGRRRGALLRALAVVPGGLRLQRRLHRRGDLLVERPGLHLLRLLGLLAAALGFLLAGGEIGFAAVQDVRQPGQAHGGAALELQVVHVPHGQHEFHVADLEFDVERGGRFADGPGGCAGGCGWQAGVHGWLRRWGGEWLLCTAREAQGAGVNLRGEQVLAGLQVLLVVRTGAGEQPHIDLRERVATAHHGAQGLPIVGQGDGAALGEFQALAHALHADADVAAVGQRRELVGRLHAGLLPAQGGRVFVAGEIRNRV